MVELDTAEDSDPDSELLPLSRPLLAPATGFLSFTATALPALAFGDFFAPPAEAFLGVSTPGDLLAIPADADVAGDFLVEPGFRPRFLRIELTYTSSSRRVVGFRVAKSISISSGLESFKPGSRLKKTANNQTTESWIKAFRHING